MVFFKEVYNSTLKYNIRSFYISETSFFININYQRFIKTVSSKTNIVVKPFNSNCAKKARPETVVEPNSLFVFNKSTKELQIRL